MIKPPCMDFVIQVYERTYGKDPYQPVSDGGPWKADDKRGYKDVDDARKMGYIKPTPVFYEEEDGWVICYRLTFKGLWMYHLYDAGLLQ